MPGIEEKAARRIRRKGPGWVFSKHDLVDLGSRSAINMMALHRLVHKGEIRRGIRGHYDVPRFSKPLDQEVGPNIDQIARALARKFGWRIQLTGPAAQNMPGLSTQVPAHYVDLSDGPSCNYRAGKTGLACKQTTLKDAGFRHGQISLIVQALKLPGQKRTSPRVVTKVRK